MKASLLCATLALILLLPICAAEPAPDEKEVTDAVRSMFSAFAADDLASFRTVTAKDFYAFDVGKRFDGEALMDVIKQAHAGGTVFVWNVARPAVHVHRDIAWITYVNEGSIQDSAGTKKMTWLESAVLRKEHGVWRVQFLHSTRAAAE